MIIQSGFLVCLFLFCLFFCFCLFLLLFSHFQDVSFKRVILTFESQGDIEFIYLFVLINFVWVGKVSQGDIKFINFIFYFYFLKFIIHLINLFLINFVRVLKVSVGPVPILNSLLCWVTR